MSELIEKQKVLDALREIATEKFSLDDPYGVYINVLMDVEEKICRLPVVQPNGPDNLVKDSQGLAKELVNDCISRKAAIDLCDWYDNPSMREDLEKLPSAQPEIIRCRECRYHYGSACDNFAGVWVKGDDFCSRAERREVSE